MEFEQDARAYLDYQVQWGNFIAADPLDRIEKSEWEIDPEEGLQITSSGFDDFNTQIWVKGGRVGAQYMLSNVITTSRGRVDRRSFKIKIVNKGV